MQTDVHIQYQEVLDMSHHGRPTIIETIYSDHGHPCISIDPDFLCWAYSHRTISGIAHFLEVHRSTVWNALCEHGILAPQEILTIPHPEEPATEETLVDVPPLENDELLDPHYPTHHRCLSWQLDFVTSPAFPTSRYQYARWYAA